MLKGYLELVRVGVEERLDQVEIKDRLEQLDVIFDGIDDLDFGGTVLCRADLGEVDGRLLDDLIRADGLGLVKDLVCDVLGGRSTI